MPPKLRTRAMASTQPDLPHDTAKRVLAIEEVLHHVLAFADNSSRLSCTTVCRAWFVTAIRILWEDVHFHNVMKLLAPTVGSTSEDTNTYFYYAGFPNQLQNQLTFNGPIPAQNWTRLLLYSPYVKRLRYHYGNVAESAIMKMALSRPVLHLFPNLRVVEWFSKTISGLLSSRIALCPTMREFHIDANATQAIDSDCASFVAFCEEIPTFLPHLSSFYIKAHLSQSMLIGPIPKVIESLAKLERCCLPKFCISGPIFLAFSRLPNLREIITYPEDWDTGYLQEMTIDKMDLGRLKEGSFPSLKTLHLPATSHRAVQLLEHPNGPRSLVSLTCNTLRYESPGKIRQFLYSITGTCPLLTSMTLDFHLPEDDEVPSRAACPWSSLRPILQCKPLVHLSITHPKPLALTVQDLEELASDRRTWKTLMLNPNPSHWNPGHRTLKFDQHTLILFAQHCPDLECLGLHFHCDDEFAAPSDQDSLLSLTISRFDVGSSIISGSGYWNFAFLLAGICSRPLEVIRNGGRWKEIEDVCAQVCKFQPRMDEIKRLRRRIAELEKNSNALC